MHNYRNIQPPEGINTSKGRPLLTFLKLLAGMLAVLALAAWLLGIAGGWLATFIPFQQEVRISELYQEEDPPEFADMQHYLNNLADQLKPALHLPAGMDIKIHYQDDDTENAFATLGGNILLYKGLLKELPNENSLAMLMAHEMAHVKLRHPIRSLGQNMAISSGIKLMMGYSNVDVLGSAGLLTQLHFSRAMETAADAEGLGAVQGLYGHVAGALELYATLHKLTTGGDGAAKTAFFSTHPLDQARIDTLNALAKEQGWLGEDAKTTPLPAAFPQWLEAAAKSQP